MKSEMIYRKIGGKYRPVGHDWTGFPIKGVWLVTDSAPPSPGEKSRHWSGFQIMKLGDLPELYPFAAMAMNQEELALLIAESRYRGNAMDLAGEILRWMATKRGGRP